MCNQTVSLIAAELERRGITTICIILLREVAEKVRPPRALFVPFRHGYALDTPNDLARQRAVIQGALAMTASGSTPPVLEDLQRRAG
jgi:hypothetical protein